MVKQLLQVSPPLFRWVEGRLELDAHTCDALALWTRNFDRIVIASPIMPTQTGTDINCSLAASRAVAELPYQDQLEVVTLPYAYRLQDFVQTYKATRQLLRQKILESQYLYLGIGALIGDWAAIACLEAIQQERAYSISSDRVEYGIIRQNLPKMPLKRRIKETLTLPLMKQFHRYLVRHASVGLFQGHDCYTAYGPFCPQAHCVYDVHTQKSDQINPDQLQRKIQSVAQGNPLRIVYVGRAAEMKGPLDWLRSIHQVIQAGVEVEATWVGDGPLLPAMQDLVQELGLDRQVRLMGFMSDRSALLNLLRSQHLFLFCHKTPEAPRCLIEALVAGCPLVGYDSPYPRGLIAEQGGGDFVPLHQWQALANLVLAYQRDRSKLVQLIQAAALSGKRFDQETVYQHRIDLIKQYAA